MPVCSEHDQEPCFIDSGRPLALCGTTTCYAEEMHTMWKVKPDQQCLFKGGDGNVGYKEVHACTSMLLL